jgi:hypothetical protein
MTESANVRSLSAIQDARAALVRFQEDAGQALDSLRQVLNQAQDWLEHDRPLYWREQVRQSYDEVAQTRTDLEACKRRTVADHRPSCIEEQKAYRKAQERLRNAQEKVDRVRHWAIQVRQESDEFSGRTGQLRRCLEDDLPRMQALLDRMLASLESYAGISGGEADVVGSDTVSSAAAGESTATENPATEKRPPREA